MRSDQNKSGTLIQLRLRSMLRLENDELPASCPFSFRCLNKSLYLIRENDGFGEYPNIYAKVCTANGSTVIVLSDTGCATEVKNPDYHSVVTPRAPEYWNLRTVLEMTINPGGRFPYLVMTTHCHYDHIMGIGKLIEGGANVTVLSSAYDRSFIDPWEHLRDHSLAPALHLKAPHYTIGLWAHDEQHIKYSVSDSGTNMDTGFITLQTPGHTPDSLSWYDTSCRLICVGDSIYETTSRDTKTSKWGPEPRIPIIFVEYSNLGMWWKSLAKVLHFVRTRNAEIEHPLELGRHSQRVSICAGHATTTSPDAEAYLLSIRAFVSRILRDEVPKKSLPDSPSGSKDVWYWDDELQSGEEPGSKEEGEKAAYNWAVQSPKRIIDEGRAQIPREEWSSSPKRTTVPGVEVNC